VAQRRSHKLLRRYQKNVTAVGKFLGQAEEDSRVLVTYCRWMTTKGVRSVRLRSRDVMRTYATLADSDVNDRVRKLELRHYE
jgi:hypothetical protein